MVIRYSLEDFTEIMKKSGSIKVDSDTINIIEQLTSKVGNPEYVRTPQFPKKNNNATNDEWDSIRNFKATEIKKKEGIDGSIDSIRKQLNKLTLKTYDKLSVKIIDEITAIIDKDDVQSVEDKCKDANINKIGEAIFNIASSSAFLSDIYAKLYVLLIQHFPILDVIFKKNFDIFSKIFHNIDYCSPNEDYDKFCENNKNNEKRRSLGLFFVNLMINNSIPQLRVRDIILDIQNYMTTIMKSEDNQNIVDELSELISIMLCKIIKEVPDVINDKLWNTVIKNIRDFASWNNKSFVSITNKSLFKHMDIVDLLDS